MLAITKSMALQGLEGYLVAIQVDISNGMPDFQIVGLPDVSVKESRERVKTAIRNSNIEFLSRRIIVNLSPANTRKEGSMFDLPIAVGILIANRNIKNSNLQKILEETIFIGELSLNGNIEKTKGILPICIEAKKLGIKRIILPKQNAKEASILKGIDILPVHTLKEVISYLNGKKEILKDKNTHVNLNHDIEYEFDFSEVKGQESVKRALEVAAAGGHNCLLIRFARFRKNYVSEEITNYFAKYEDRRSIRSYKNLQYTWINRIRRTTYYQKTFSEPTSYYYTSIFSGWRKNSKATEKLV